MDRPKSDYKEYPKTLPPDDFWGQVRRTRYGKPASEEEIAAIVESIRSGLQLRSSDAVLDLACGNGALSVRLFDSCRKLVGVDFSEYLVSIARDNFQRPPDYTFEVGDMRDWVAQDPAPERFTKVLCYASAQFLSPSDLESVVTTIARRYGSVERVMLGNLPDSERAALFYKDGRDYAAELRDPTAQIGVWWSREELTGLAERAGMRVEFARLPQAVFNAEYRFDAVLTPAR